MRWRPLLPWLLALGVVLLFLAVQGRYTLRGTSQGWTYRMDRWTGEMVLIAGQRSFRVKTPEETEAADALETTTDMTTEPFDPITDWRSRFLEEPGTTAPPPG